MIGGLTIGQALLLAGVFAAIGIGGTQSMMLKDRATQIEALTLENSRLTGSLETCNFRIRNIQEAEESNASIPHDLDNFDPAPWLLPPAGADTAPD